jgi:hypothetical protein
MLIYYNELSMFACSRVCLSLHPDGNPCGILSFKTEVIPRHYMFVDHLLS